MQRLARGSVAVFLLASLVVARTATHAGAARAATATPGSLVSAVPATTTPNIEDGSGYEVDSIVQVGSSVIQGGLFTTVDPPGSKSGGVARTDLFAADATTGAISSTFVPTVNGDVDAMVAGPTAGTVFIGGSFTTVDGVAAKSLALLSVSDGTIVPGFTVPSLNGIVNSMVISNGRLILGGTFGTVAGVAHAGVASLNVTTGKLDPYISIQLAGHHNYGVNCIPSSQQACPEGGIGVQQLAVSPDGTQMMLVGNFTSATDAVASYHRDQVARILLGSRTATVDPNWATQRYTAACYDTYFDTYMRGVAYAPDGSYFAIVATGGGGQSFPSSTGCDAAARFESASSGLNVQPTWMDYTGNDTLFAVAVTSSAVYVGGHQRWMNNANGADAAGPGALPRAGLAALDPLNGLPYSWNPGRNPRGAHVSVLYATAAGLWVGGDTDYIGNRQYYRGKDSFFPYAGGESLPASATTSLPANVYLGGQPANAASNVLYRINAGGPPIQAIDNGPNWAEDDGNAVTSSYHNAGSQTSSYAPSVGGVTSNVPASTPLSIFDTERWDPGSKGDGGEMQWQLPVTAGTPIEVRVYLANRNPATSLAGQRVFDVGVDGQVVSNYDIVQAVGNNSGTMLAVDENAPASGVVTISFTHEVNNPLVDGIEIVKTGAAVSPAADGSLSTYTFDGTTVGTPATVAASTSATFSNDRGAFMVDNRLIYASDNGNLYAATFDGTTLGTPTLLDPYDDPAWDNVVTGSGPSGSTYQGVKPGFDSEIPQVTGMAYANGFLFYTLFDQPGLYYRYFEPESGVVGATEFMASTSVNLSNIEGMFISGGTLYWADGTSGNLMSAAFTGPSAPGGNVTTAAVTGGATVVNSAMDWRARALFLGPPQPAQPPVASFTASCTGATCSFDASSSHEAGGTIASYAWTFGDYGTGTGVNPSHTYHASGSDTVTLTVTDANGVTASSTQTVTTAATITYVGASDKNSSAAASSVAVPSGTSVGDLLLLFASVTGSPAAVTGPGTSWTLLGSQTPHGVTTYVWEKSATAADLGSTASVSFGTKALRSDVEVVAYHGVTGGEVRAFASTNDSSTTTHTTPGLATTTPNDWVVSYWAARSAVKASSWTAPSGQTMRSASIGTTASAHVDSLLTDYAGAVGSSVPPLTSTSSGTSGGATDWTLELAAS